MRTLEMVDALYVVTGNYLTGMWPRIPFPMYMSMTASTSTGATTLSVLPPTLYCCSRRESGPRRMLGRVMPSDGEGLGVEDEQTGKEETGEEEEGVLQAGRQAGLLLVCVFCEYCCLAAGVAHADAAGLGPCTAHNL